jgi:transcriptional regulator with XRE-family HTH domain
VEVLGRRIRELRLAHGLTQEDLAVRAGVSRQLVGAVEAGRHLPRVDAAVAIARVLGAPVEDLLAPAASEVVGVLAPPRDGQPVRVARVGDLLVCVPARPAGESWAVADAVVHGGTVDLIDAERPAAVVAGCDPALGLIERLVGPGTDPGVLAVSTSSSAAVATLRAGHVHAAVVHGPAGRLPAAPKGVHRFLVTRWQVGLVAPPDLPRGWAGRALAGRVKVVQREAGAGSQTAFERAAKAAGASLPIEGPRVAGHVEAAQRAATGGIPAVSIEPAALATGLAFHALEEHVSELWVAGDHLGDPGVRRFTDELTGARLHRRLEAIGGYDLTDCGTAVPA